MKTLEYRGSPETTTGRFYYRDSCLLQTLVLLVCLLLPALPHAAEPTFDLHLRSDYGRAEVWINTLTGEFRWQDAGANLSITGTGTLAFPNLGPIVFFFSGQIKGYDWVSISLKIYGRSASGFLAAFPEGELVRKVTSNFYDADSSDDGPPEKAVKKVKTTPKRTASKPEIGPITPKQPEIPVRPE